MEMIFFASVVGFFYIYGFNYIFKKLGLDKIEKIEREMKF